MKKLWAMIGGMVAAFPVLWGMGILPIPRPNLSVDSPVWTTLLKEAQDPNIRKLQQIVSQVEGFSTYAECAQNVPAMSLAGGMIALRSDLLRYPDWLTVGQVYETCLRSCPAAKQACSEAYGLFHKADGWLRANPPPARRSPPPRRGAKK